MGRVFGTDGVRGRAGVPPLDPGTIRRLGAALVRSLRTGDGPVRVLAGRDTRESGGWIERELAFGVAAAGGMLTSAGVIPTPAIAYLTPRERFTAGVVISASHNPFEDNGIKMFSGAGEKFTEAGERRIESILDDTSWSLPEGEAPPVAVVDLRDAYVAHLERILIDRPEGTPSGRSGRQGTDPGSVRAAVAGMRIAVDCANGATVSVAPRVLRDLGLDATFVGDRPDGRNINLACGSTHPEMLVRTVVDGGFHLGVAFDGDGDRAILVSADGRLVDGDAVMLMCAKQMKAEGRLAGDTVVATVMSNIGLELALRDAGVALRRTAVGDKHVMEEMVRGGFALGGEQSGHVIFADHLLTGDGLATALHVLRVIAATGRGLADLASELTTFPQVLLNLRVPRRVDLQAIPDVASVVSSVEARLSGHGRLLVRYSGTEPLLRVMLEGRDEADIRRWGQEIVDAVRLHIR